MKPWPTTLVGIALGVLLYVSSNRPDANAAAPVLVSAPTTKLHEVTNAESGSAADPAAPGVGIDPSEPNSELDPEPVPVWDPQQISGTVQNGSGLGTPGMIVHATPEGSGQAQQITTGADGRFAFANLANGSYRVTASDPDFLYTVCTGAQVRVPTSAETVIQVDRGRCAINGMVLNSQDAKFPDVTIRATSGEFEASVRTDAKGEYRLGGLPTGRWNVTASIPRTGTNGTLDVSTEVELTPGAAMEMAPFKLVAPASFSLTLTTGGHHGDEEEDESDHGHSHAPSAAAGATVTVTPDDSDLDTIELAADDEGHIYVETLWPGIYEVTATRADGTSLLASPLRVNIGENGTYEWSVPISRALHGAGIVVPMEIKVFLVVLFAALFGLPAVIFPQPIVPRPPPGYVPPSKADEGAPAEG